MIGQQFSHYRILSLLGEGGMASVYRAEQLGLRRIIALKILHPALARDEVIVERFLREARIAANLNHEHIVTIYDVGEEGGVYYIAMRYIEGESFAQLLRRDGPLAPERALTMLGQVADALDFAHAHGILHRDVKPGNVMVEPGDFMTLTDFGIARAAALSALTAAHAVIGTPAYMSPEQARGDPVDKRSDLYALGIMLYEALGGRPPFMADNTPGLLFMHVHQPPRPLSELRPDLPWELSAVVSKTLAKHPDDRYQSAHDLISAARAALTGWCPGADEPETTTLAPAWPLAPRTSSSPPPSRQTAPVRPAPPAASAASYAATPTLRPAQPTVPPYPAPDLPRLFNQGAGTRPSTPELTHHSAPMLLPAAAPSGPRREGSGVGPADGNRMGNGTRRPASLKVWSLAMGLMSCVLLLIVGTYLVTRSELWDRPVATATAPPTVIAIALPTSTARPVESTPTPVPAPIAPAPTVAAQPTIPPTDAPTPAPPSTPDVPARVALAQGSVAAGDFPAAIQQLERVRQDPAVRADRALGTMVDETLRKAHLAYGNRLLEQGKLDDSYAQFKAMLDIAPNDPDAIDGQKRVILTKNDGIMEANWGKDDEVAIRALEDNMQIDANFRQTRPKLYALLIAKADRLLDAGDRDGAYPVLMRALAVLPDRPEAMQRLRPYTPTPATPSRVPPTTAPYVPPSGPSGPFTPPGSPV